MCGITGFWDRSGTRGRSWQEPIRDMTDAIAHRGPDGAGVWVDDEAGVALGHRRLAILDLSAAGTQPMRSADGRWVLSFNGEFYNYRELRTAVEAAGSVDWRGTSDTEVFLEYVSRYGPIPALEAASGMFAFALWDSHTRSILLARDRLGEKPLYAGWSGDVLLFGSELKALARHPSWHPTIDRGALALYMRFGYVPAPYSIWQGIEKVPAGTWVRYAADAGQQPERGTYWSAQQTVLAGLQSPLTLSDEAATDALELVLRRAVASQMEADVPLGAFLSGGIDSSVITALMQAQSDRPIRTFSIGFGDRRWDESPFAEAVARHLGTAHTTIQCDGASALAVVPMLARIYDEPFGDSSQIPTRLLAALTREHVTVALSGDGGDELFGGYNRYLAFARQWALLSAVPLPLRRVGGRALRQIPDFALNRLGALLGIANAADKVTKIESALSANTADAAYRQLLSQWPNPAEFLVEPHEPHHDASEARWSRTGADIVDRMMATDLVTYLPDDILVKVDRAAMSVGLEARVPFLDPAVVAFAWQLPRAMRIRGRETKWLLRQVLSRHVPEVLWDRPKQGFGIPLARWLRSELREWAEDLLDEDSMRADGLLRPAPVRAAWESHVAGRSDHHYGLWTILMFQSWKRTWGP